MISIVDRENWAVFALLRVFTSPGPPILVYFWYFGPARTKRRNSNYSALITPRSKALPKLLVAQLVHYRVHKSSLLDTIRSQLNPAHIFPPCFSIHFNIILQSAPTSPKRFFLSRFPDNFVCVYRCSYAYYMHNPSHTSWFDYPNNIGWSVQIMKPLIMQFYPILLWGLLPLSYVQILSSSPCSFNMCSFLRMKDQISHLHRTEGKIIDLCSLLSPFIDKRWDVRRFWKCL
jgi:hypothetical protein